VAAAGAADDARSGGSVLAYLPVPKVAGELLALGLAVALAQAVGGRLAPVVSAAVLPVVFGITTWVYPAAVAGICLVLVVMVSLPGFAQRRLAFPWSVRSLGGHGRRWCCSQLSARGGSFWRRWCCV
jgi:hypothetical protein